jgi:hypothetical protein
VFLPKFLTKFFTKKKLALLLLICCLLSVLIARPILAFSTPTARGGYLFTFEQAVFQTDEMNLQSFVNEAFKATATSIWTSLVGCWSCDQDERERYPGFIFAAANFITGIYASPPASGSKYLAHLGNKLGIVKPVHAQEQGIGFQAMQNLIPLWETFRNLAYGLFVIVFVIIGFAIMFRVKISPQAVITIQSALPKMIIALLLITFSYAIVGFMIDIMYIIIFLINTIFSELLFDQLGKNVGDVLRALLDNVGDFFGDIGPENRMAGLMVRAIFNQLVFFFIVPLMALLVIFVLGPIGWLLGFFLALVILITLLRCVWTLLRAYAMVIINLIFAPLIIVVGALPGSNAIGSWFRNLLANLAVLPVMVTMFYLASYMIMLGLIPIVTNPAFMFIFIISLIPGLGQIIGTLLVAGGIAVGTPVVITAILVPKVTFWQFFTSLLLPIIGLVILLMAPRVSDIIQSFISGRPFAYGTALGQAVAAPTVLAGYGAQLITTGTRIGEAWRTRLGTRLPGGAQAGETTAEEAGG